MDWRKKLRLEKIAHKDCPTCEKILTPNPTYYIVEIDTLVEESAYDNYKQPGIKAYSIISVDQDGAHEVDRAYRTVKEALRAWPEAIPPANDVAEPEFVAEWREAIAKEGKD